MRPTSYDPVLTRTFGISDARLLPTNRVLGDHCPSRHHDRFFGLKPALNSGSKYGDYRRVIVQGNGFVAVGGFGAIARIVPGDDPSLSTSERPGCAEIERAPKTPDNPGLK
jgi:hypothetical protein